MEWRDQQCGPVFVGFSSEANFSTPDQNPSLVDYSGFDFWEISVNDLISDSAAATARHCFGSQLFRNDSRAS
jgi:hypothetical protein